MNGTELLADFRGYRSEAAFRELVRRYTNLVYSVAKRRLSNVTVFSKYDPVSRKNPIPIAVMTTGTYGSMKFTKRFVVTDAQFNVPVDPVSWTLAGLGMHVGTDVSDSRTMRRIGQQTAVDLRARRHGSDSLPRRARQGSRGCCGKTVE